MKENFLKVRLMVREIILKKMDHFMLENEKMINKMDLELRLDLMEQSLKVFM